MKKLNQKLFKKTEKEINLMQIKSFFFDFLNKLIKKQSKNSCHLLKNNVFIFCIVIYKFFLKFQLKN